MLVLPWLCHRYGRKHPVLAGLGTGPGTYCCNHFNTYSRRLIQYKDFFGIKFFLEVKISIIYIRRFYGHHIFVMEIPILVRGHLYIDKHYRGTIQYKDRELLYIFILNASHLFIHYDKDEMVMRPFHLYNRISYTGKMMVLYWIGLLFPVYIICHGSTPWQLWQKTIG